MVVFLNGDTDYAEKKVVFKGQADYRIGRVEGDSSPNKNAAGNVAVEFGDLVCYNRALNENMAGKGIKCKRQRLE